MVAVFCNDSNENSISTYDKILQSRKGFCVEQIISQLFAPSFEAGPSRSYVQYHKSKWPSSLACMLSIHTPVTLSPQSERRLSERSVSTAHEHCDTKSVPPDTFG